MNTYDIIYEELQDRVYNGEISLEFAESVNDLAYDKYYFTEMKKKADYRREKFLKQHNYDPKTKTIDLDGQKVRFKFIGGSNKRHMPSNACMVEEIRRYRNNNGEKYTKRNVKEVEMDNAAFNMKHPKSHEFSAGHEIAGHIENERKNERKTAGFSGKFDDSFSGLPDEAKRIYLEISKLNKKAENRTLTADEYKKAKQLAHKLSEIKSKRFNDHNDKAKFKALVSDVDQMISEMLSKGVELNQHGMFPYEYIADYAGAARMQDGKKIAKKTLTELEKRAMHPKTQQKDKNAMKYAMGIPAAENRLIPDLKAETKRNKKNLKNATDMANRAERMADAAYNKYIKFSDKPVTSRLYKTGEREYLSDIASDLNKHALDMGLLQIQAEYAHKRSKDKLKREKQKLKGLNKEIDDTNKEDNERIRNEIALRKKSLDMMDKNPNASFIRDKNKGNKNK